MLDIDQALAHLRAEHPEIADLLQAIRDEAKAHPPVPLAPPIVPYPMFPPVWNPYGCNPCPPWTITVTTGTSSSLSTPAQGT